MHTVSPKMQEVLKMQSLKQNYSAVLSKKKITLLLGIAHLVLDLSEDVSSLPLPYLETKKIKIVPEKEDFCVERKLIRNGV